MIKYAITVTYDDRYYDFDDWKYNICEDFDENVVVVATRDTNGVENASWWIDAKDVLSDIDYGDEEDFIYNNSGFCSKSKLKDIYALYEKEGSDTDDPEFIADVAMILYPFLNLKVSDIRGYHTSTDVVYVADAVDLDTLEDWWFGNIYLVSAYELDLDAMEEDEVDIEYLDLREVHDYGTEIAESDFQITQTEYMHLDDALQTFASDFGLSPEDCVLIEE